MEYQFRKGNIDDLESLKALAIKSWSQFKPELSDENWQKLLGSLQDDNTYIDLLTISECILCIDKQNQIIGMAFWVPSGNPTEIYQNDWSYIRFVTVDPEYSGKGIGKELTKKCIELAINNNEKSIALHTSELMKPAMHIYESLGFTIVKEIDNRLGKRYWLYKLDLK